MTTALLVIDPQNDFMDSPHFQGSLAVQGAYADMQRLSSYLDKNTPDAIFITMDTHAEYDISHAAWWVDKNGCNPNPFTIITPEDVQLGTWKASDPTEQNYSEFYVNELHKQNKYPLCVWPYHCIKNTKGHEVEETFSRAVAQWEEKTQKQAQYIYKGMNPKTEHYSGLKAEVQLDDDDLTKLNVVRIKELDSFDKIEVAGEAQSHCVFSTTMDLLENIVDSSKVSLLTDCMSPVSGFEQNALDFLQLAQNKGANLKKVQKNSLKI